MVVRSFFPFSLVSFRRAIDRDELMEAIDVSSKAWGTGHDLVMSHSLEMMHSKLKVLLDVRASDRITHPFSFHFRLFALLEPLPLLPLLPEALGRRISTRTRFS